MLAFKEYRSSTLIFSAVTLSAASAAVVIDLDLMYVPFQYNLPSVMYIPWMFPLLVSKLNISSEEYPCRTSGR